MKRWFLAQPIHRKLVLISMAKTTVVLGLAMAVLLALDAWRFQRNATSAADALASIASESIRAALVLEDGPAVAATLNTLRLQSSVQLACAYRANGALFSQFARDGAVCPASPPARIPWNELAALTPVQQNDTVVGSVFIQLTWSAMQTRLLTAGLASLGLLVLVTGLMAYLSHRLYRNITTPIAQLVGAARRFGQEGDPPAPIRAHSSDEVGELVKAFNAMAARVRTANRHLNEVNASLQREVDERRAIEVEREALLVREREANRTKDEFLAVVSHELRTPLNAIVGWSRILVSTEPDRETINKASASLHRNALAQARVIDDLIDISRIVTGKLTVVSEPVDLCAVVEAAVDSTRSLAQRASVTVTLRLPSVPCVVIGDRHRLRQVVSNLLSNAVKFAPRSIVTVQLQPEASSLRLSVADTGIGIAPEFIDHVFDRFRQADASHTRDHGGLGLGLTIAKQLVELHGGSIRAESGGRGLGATMTVTLPWSAQLAKVDGSDDVLPLLTDVSILAVDDNSDALELLEAALSQAGAIVRVASSGAEALEIWQAKPADVLLCDLAMPRMSGYEVLAGIREMDRAKGRMTPAIAVTAHATEEQVARSAQAGFQVHVAKPFDAARLIRAISVARGRV